MLYKLHSDADVVLNEKLSTLGTHSDTNIAVRITNTGKRKNRYFYLFASLFCFPKHQPSLRIVLITTPCCKWIQWALRKSVCMWLKLPFGRGNKLASQQGMFSENAWAMQWKNVAISQPGSSQEKQILSTVLHAAVGG